ncbi:MAG: tetratricopeptide repeat protein [Candidatus Marinimicrobia bacterium]|nr:tetratricopeptide repeat protein [Candidatus Neomarinimicrobiota bacterium]
MNGKCISGPAASSGRLTRPAVLALLLAGSPLTRGSLIVPYGDAADVAAPSATRSYAEQLDARAIQVLLEASQIEGQDQVINVQALSDRLFQMVEKGQPSQALRAARKLAELSPDSPEAQRLLGHLNYVQGLAAEAVPPLRRALELNDQDMATRMLLGVALADAGQFNEALRHLATAQRAAPRDGELRHNIGVVLLRAERFEDAVTQLRLACRLRPENAISQHDLGLALLGADKMDEAIEAFQAAIEKDPKYLQARRNLAAAYVQTGRLAEAVPWLAGIILDDGPTEVWSELLNVLWRLADGSGPLTPLGADDNFEATYRQAVEALRQDRPMESMRLLLRVFATRPELAGPANDLGALLAAQKHEEAALLFFGRAAALAPDEGPAQRNVETLRGDLMRRARLRGAAEHWETERENPAKAYEARVALGNIYGELGELPAAQTAWREAAELAPSAALPHLMLGRIAEDQGRRSAAERHYRAALFLEPGQIEALTRLATVLLHYNQPGPRRQGLRLAERVQTLTGGENPNALQLLSAAQALNGLHVAAQQTALAGAVRALLQNNQRLAQTLFNDWQLYGRLAAGAAPAGPTPA